MIFVSDRAANVKEKSVVQSLHVLPPTTQPIAGSINSGAHSANTSVSTHTNTAANTTLGARYRPRPPQSQSSNLTFHTGKRKHANSRLIRYFEDMSSEDDETDEREGNGRSSGEPASSNDRAHAKRPRISGTARSPSNPPICDVGIQDTLSSSSPTPADTRSSSAVSQTSTSVPVVHEDALSFSTTAITMPTLPTNPPPNSPADTVEMTDLPGGGTSHANHIAPEISPAEADGSIEHEFAARSPPAVDPPITAPLLVSSRLVDLEKVPAFLRCHGKGNRTVDIFNYLNKLQDPHFQQVLFHFVNFEINDKSNGNGSLPTAGRPAEISQWSSRARPANLPEYAKGGRTFRTFVDSVFKWWGSIQPSWRSIERGVVSREVQGDWKALRAPRINGLLNVVILVYWWSRILEEHKPKDGNRADYEFFADDVAWVLSHLSS